MIAALLFISVVFNAALIFVVLDQNKMFQRTLTKLLDKEGENSQMGAENSQLKARLENIKLQKDLAAEMDSLKRGKKPKK